MVGNKAIRFLTGKKECFFNVLRTEGNISPALGTFIFRLMFYSGSLKVFLGAFINALRTEILCYFEVFE